MAEAKASGMPPGLAWAGLVWQSDAGQDLAEYAILIGLIALVVVGAVTLFGQGVVALFQHITSTLPFGGS